MRLVWIAFVSLTLTGLVSHSTASQTGSESKEKTPNQPSRQQINSGNLVEAGQWPWQAFISQKVMSED